MGAAGESDFLYIRVWQEFQVRCGFQEGYRTGEYLSRRLHSFNILLFRHDCSIRLRWFAQRRLATIEPFLLRTGKNVGRDPVDQETRREKDRKSVVSGKTVYVRGDLGGSRI